MQLKKELGASQLFTLSFGAIIGVGWVILLGDWLHQAGPMGAILAFLAGGALTGLVGLCYGELGALFPVDGGEVAYSYQIYGLKTCFATGWFLVMAYISTTIFEALSVGRISATLLSGLQGRTLYMSQGNPVQLGSLLLGVVGMVLITILNYIGVRPATKMQDILTYSKIALAFCFIVAGLVWGKTANLEPLFQRSSKGLGWDGFFTVFLTTPFWLSGFQVVSQVVGEKKAGTSQWTIGRIILLSIVASTLFYCLVILACSMTMPWQQLPALKLPAATVFEIAFHSPTLAKVVLLVALLGNLTVWNSTSLAASRLLFVLGRAHIIPRSFGTVSARFSVPGQAVLFVGALVVVGLFFGRGAIQTMVNVASSCYALAFILVCWGVVRVRGKRTRGMGNAATAKIAALVSVGILCVSLYQPYSNAGKLPLEWILFIGWGLFGGLFWVAARKIRRELTERERRQAILGAELGEAMSQLYHSETRP